jgi:hypothetical protein
MVERVVPHTARAAWILALFLVVACGNPGHEDDVAPQIETGGGGTAVPCTPTSDDSVASCATAAVMATMRRVAQNTKDCKEPVPVYEGGRVVGELCPEAAAISGLTVVDLSDVWVPRVLRGGDQRVPYADTFVKLANERLGPSADGSGTHPDWDRARRDRYFELYGVFPSLSVVRKRLADDERHRCHDDVDKAGLEALQEGVNTWRPLSKQRSDRGHMRNLKNILKTAAGGLDKASIHELADHPVYRDHYRQYTKLDARFRAVAAMQEHLRCEGFLDQGMTGMLDATTISAMQTYHKRHMLVSWQLDDETRRTLLADSRELDFRTLLRSLRERVVDATGLIEDGSASEQPGKVVDRVLDAKVFRAGTSRSNDESIAAVGAPDLIAAAADTAARALGWLGPAAARSFLDSAKHPERVAVKLPPTPSYHAPHMALRVEIDRGDLWYDFPFTMSGNRKLQLGERRPTLTVYVDDPSRPEGDRALALARWPTTIGGWQPERLDNGDVKLVYKESPVGQRVMRDVVAAPRWVPPRSTPERDLVRPRKLGRWALRNDSFGPHYASAYGMVMMIHHRVDRHPSGKVIFTDQGIRSHGSASYESILDGFSHGCHRLHNHRAVRMSGFMLAHREHEVRGPIPLDYTRSFRWRGKKRKLEFESRGYRYELTPPVEVEVLPGNVKGRAKRVLAPRKLTRPMMKRYK